jgi:hypothetical protein
MDLENLLSAIVGGVLGLVGAFGAIYLTDRLRERRRIRDMLLDAAATFYASSQRAAIQMNLYYQETDEGKKQNSRNRYDEYDVEVRRAKFKLAVLLACKDADVVGGIEELYVKYRACQNCSHVRDFINSLEKEFARLQRVISES